MFENLTEKWASLAARERKIIMVGGIVAAVLLFYSLIWSPFSSAVSALTKQVRSQRELAVWMRHATDRIQGLRAQGFKAQTIGAQSLLAVVDNFAQKQQISRFIAQIRQADDNSVSVDFDAVPFDNLIHWLTELWKQYGIAVTKTELSPIEPRGLVKGNVILQMKS